MVLKVALEWRYRLLLADKLPKNHVSMPLTVKIRPQGVDGLTGWEQSLKMAQALLLFLELSQDFHVVFS